MVRRDVSFLVVGILVLALPGAMLISVEHESGSSQYSGTLANTSPGNFSEALKDMVHKTAFAATVSENQSGPYAYSSPFYGPSSAVSSGAYSVNFTSYGIPTGRGWHLDIGGQNYSTSSKTVSINLATGNYSYTYGSPDYSPLIPTGKLTVSSSNTSAMVGFVSSITVSKTLSLSNGTVNKGNLVPSNSNSAPIGIIKDPKNNLTYVADSGLNKVYALGAGNKIVASIYTGLNPSELAYDGLNGYVYVTNAGSGSVSAINAANSVVANFTAGDFPFGVTYNPSNGYIYVANALSNNVTVIVTSQGSAGNLLTSIQLPSGVDPFTSIYDPSMDRVLFTNFNGNNVISIDGTRISSMIGVYGSPAMMAYDSLNGNVYVTDSQSSASTGAGYLSIIGTNGLVTENISLGGIVNPFAISFDSVRNLLYITGANSNQIAVLNPVNKQFIDHADVGTSPYGILDSGQNGNIEVTNFGSGTISFLNYTAPVSNITFIQKGLPQGKSWSVTLNGVSQSSGKDSLSFSEIPSDYNYSVSKAMGYRASPSSGNIFLASGTASVNVYFSKLYNASFIENGLPPGMKWGVNIAGGNYTTLGNSIGVPISNGTYSITYFVQGSDSFGATGKVLTVNGSSVSVQVPFVGLYGLYISEKGLYKGTNWKVNVSGNMYSSNNGSMDLHLPNGTYNFSAYAVEGYQLLKEPGNVTIDGSSVTGYVFYGKLYVVTFYAHGLYWHTNWEINMGGTNYSSNLVNISVYLLNGSYKFTVFPVPGYAFGEGNGNIIVDGANESLQLNFTRLYFVTVKEEGLSAGHEWSISTDTGAFSSNSSKITLSLANGSYWFQASSVKGYTAKNRAANFTIDGKSRTFTIEYDRLYTVTLVQSGLNLGTLWWASFGNYYQDSTSNSMQFNVTNGTYSYAIQHLSGYKADPSEGVMHVSGSNNTINVKFVPITNVTFYENGVPDNTTWHLRINGSQYGINARSMTLPLGNGSYSYQAYYYHYGSKVEVSGFFSVKHSEMKVSIDFPHLYTVSIFETGLEKEASWSVNLSGFNISSQNSSIVLYLQNGTYNMTISSSSNQSFQLKINSWAVHDSTDLNVSGHYSKSLDEMPPLTVSGRNMSVAVHFDQSGSSGHRGHGGHNGIGMILEDIDRVAAYIGHIIEYAVTNMPSGFRLS